MVGWPGQGTDPYHSLLPQPAGSAHNLTEGDKIVPRASARAMARFWYSRTLPSLWALAPVLLLSADGAGERRRQERLLAQAVNGYRRVASHHPRPPLLCRRWKPRHPPTTPARVSPPRRCLTALFITHKPYNVPSLGAVCVAVLHRATRPQPRR
jgi:hypothetical protein